MLLGHCANGYCDNCVVHIITIIDKLHKCTTVSMGVCIIMMIDSSVTSINLIHCTQTKMRKMRELRLQIACMSDAVKRLEDANMLLVPMKI